MVGSPPPYVSGWYELTSFWTTFWCPSDPVVNHYGSTTSSSCIKRRLAEPKRIPKFGPTVSEPVSPSNNKSTTYLLSHYFQPSIKSAVTVLDTYLELLELCLVKSTVDVLKRKLTFSPPTHEVFAPQETPTLMEGVPVTSVGTQSFHNDSLIPLRVFSPMKCISTQMNTATEKLRLSRE